MATTTVDTLIASQVETMLGMAYFSLRSAGWGHQSAPQQAIERAKGEVSRALDEARTWDNPGLCLEAWSAATWVLRAIRDPHRNWVDLADYAEPDWRNASA